MARSGVSGIQLREIVLIAGPALILIAGAFWLAFQFVEPAPPQTVTITSGSEGGGYHTFAKQYAKILARSGIDLKVLTSAGSMENLKRLSGDEPTADLALMQGGIATSSIAAGQELPELNSLGRLFPEPLWIFYSSERTIRRLGEVKGLRLAIGAAGSGTRTLVEALLTPNGIAADNTDLRPLGGRAAADALKAGTVDVAFLVLSPRAPLVGELLRSDGLKLMSLERAEAYTRLFPYLSRVVLPEGVVDLVQDIPAQDIEMVAAQSALVAHPDAHPAIITLMVEALKEVHSAGGMFQRVEEFPQAHDPEYEMSADASRIYRDGPSFLKRYLPFWLATFVERSIVMAVPIATILIPLFKIVPWIYETRIKSRIFFWFQELRKLEKQMETAGNTANVAGWRAEIEEIDRAVNNIPVPWHYADRYYELKAAVDLVRQRISARA